MDSRGHARSSSSSSSSSSFDSCSDLLSSFEFPPKDSLEHAVLEQAQPGPCREEIQDKESSVEAPMSLPCKSQEDYEGGTQTKAVDSFQQDPLRQVDEGEQSISDIKLLQLSKSSASELLARRGAEGKWEPGKGLNHSLAQQSFNIQGSSSGFLIDMSICQRLSSSNAELGHDSHDHASMHDTLETRSDERQEHGSNRETTFHSLDADTDLQRLENSIKHFTLHKCDSPIGQPPPLLSSGSGRPDLEEVDWQGSNESNLVSIQLINQQGHVNETSDSQLTIDEKKLDGLGFPLVSSEVLHLVGAYSNRICTLNEDNLHVTIMNSLDSASGQVTASKIEDCKSLDMMEPDYQPFADEEWKGSRILRAKPADWEEESLGPDELFRYVEALDVNETYIGTVLDMEDVLLNSDESGRGRFFLFGNPTVGTLPPSRDGSLSSLTSGTQLFASEVFIPFVVDWVEVVGARQRKGGSSLGERMVGVKDHTVYCIKVISGKQEWEVLRRYRTFVELYHQLKRMFNTKVEKTLPSPWEEVESESRKVFGNTSPNIIEVRSFRIERCLQSLIQEGPPFSTASPLFWFLRPQDFSGEIHFEDHLSTRMPLSQRSSDVQLGSLDSPLSPRSDAGSSRAELDHDKNPFTLGKTIKLVLKVYPNKPLKQLLYAQHHSCAGCYKHLDVEKGLMQGFVQTLGWGKPRLCEYSGQLFCASCHMNETAVLPALVLQNWDFTPRRVSQLAKAYLDSIYDQPMLCVSAVNPYLYSRVPILSHVKETRRKLSRMLSCIRCPSRNRIQQTMGSRKYLLENNDFFALRDLEDLSKGAFAVLPGVLTAVLENLKLHITKQCSVCQEMGEWCGAGILCEEPFNPIFPFQEENVTKCKTCSTLYHHNCFLKCSTCPFCAQEVRAQKALQGGEGKTACEEDDLRGDDTEAKSFPDPHASDEHVPSSLSTASMAQASSSELVKGSQSLRNWGLYYLLPKPRLW